MREQVRVTISGEASRRRGPGSCRARQQQSRPACRSTLSGICSWIKCQASAWRGGPRQRRARFPSCRRRGAGHPARPAGPNSPARPEGGLHSHSWSVPAAAPHSARLPSLPGPTQTRCALPSSAAGCSRQPPCHTPGQALPGQTALALPPCGQGAGFEGVRSRELLTPAATPSLGDLSALCPVT